MLDIERHLQFIIAHHCPLWLKKHFLLQLANIIAYYCVLYNTIFTLLYSGIFYILNFYYCPLLPTLAKKALLPSPGFPGFPGMGKPGLGNIANPDLHVYIAAHKWSTFINIQSDVKTITTWRHKCTFYEKLDHLKQKPFTLRETRHSYLSSDILFVSRNLSVN